jgi:hypothetical protein
VSTKVYSGIFDNKDAASCLDRHVAEGDSLGRSGRGSEAVYPSREAAVQPHLAHRSIGPLWIGETCIGTLRMVRCERPNRPAKFRRPLPSVSRRACRVAANLSRSPHRGCTPGFPQ